MTQEELLQERMNGKLPVIDIAGHPFYVDLRMSTLRPKDDFMTPGIPLKAFDDFEGPEGFTWLPYDPKKHDLKVISFDRVKQIPKDWIIVEIPLEHKLDPYGYACEQGFPLQQILEENPIQQNLKARIVPWEETSIPEIIKRNNTPKNSRSIQSPSHQPSPKPSRKR